MLLEVFFELRYRFLPNVRWIPNHTVKPARAHDLADGGGHAALCRGGSRTAPTFGWRIALRATIRLCSGDVPIAGRRWGHRRYSGNEIPIEGVDAVAFIFRKQHALVIDIRADQGIPAHDVVF